MAIGLALLGARQDRHMGERDKPLLGIGWCAQGATISDSCSEGVKECKAARTFSDLAVGLNEIAPDGVARFLHHLELHLELGHLA